MTFFLQLPHPWEDELNNVVQMGFVGGGDGGGGGSGAAPSGQGAEGILMSSSQLNLLTLTSFEQITKLPIFILQALSHHQVTQKLNCDVIASIYYAI